MIPPIVIFGVVILDIHIQDIIMRMRIYVYIMWSILIDIVLSLLEI